MCACVRVYVGCCVCMYVCMSAGVAGGAVVVFGVVVVFVAGVAVVVVVVVVVVHDARLQGQSGGALALGAPQYDGHSLSAGGMWPLGRP